MSDRGNLSGFQQAALIVLRTLIGWHFLYEGYHKLVLPAWTHGGLPIGRWSSAGYLQGAGGPLADLFRLLVQQGWTAWIDYLVVIGLVLVGLSLMLGVATQAGCYGALFFLSLFYLLYVPLAGSHQPGTEGAYLLVNKNLIELAAVVLLIAFRTDRLAGLDLLWRRAHRAG